MSWGKGGWLTGTGRGSSNTEKSEVGLLFFSLIGRRNILHKYTNTQIQMQKYKYKYKTKELQIHKYKDTNIDGGTEMSEAVCSSFP